MSDDLRKQLENHRKDLEELINQYTSEKQILMSFRNKFLRQTASEGIGALIGIATESTSLGKQGKRWGKAALEDEFRKNVKNLENRYLHMFENQLNTVRVLLSDASTLRPSNPHANTEELIRRIERVNERTTFSGKANRLIQIIAGLLSKEIVRNSELAALAGKFKDKKQAIISPGTPYSAKREIERILEQAQKYVYIIDTYIDEKTLDVLLAVSKGVQIKILTQKRRDWPDMRFILHCKDFAIERPGFEIRIADSRLIHDRFILTDRDSCQIGSSLKDFGKSMTSLIILDKQASVEANSLFQEIWKESAEMAKQ